MQQRKLARVPTEEQLEQRSEESQAVLRHLAAIEKSAENHGRDLGNQGVGRAWGKEKWGGGEEGAGFKGKGAGEG